MVSVSPIPPAEMVPLPRRNRSAAPALFLVLSLLPAPSGPAGAAEGAASPPPAAEKDEAEGTWPGWRGPRRDGTSRDRPRPRGLGEDRLERVWRVSLGQSYSGPVVDRERVYVTETEDNSHECVRALDRASGKEIWAARWEGSIRVPFFAAQNGSWIRATPLLDEGRLFVAGMRDRLVALDARTGTVQWDADLMARHGTPIPAFGFVASPLASGDRIYVQAAAGIVAVSKSTGETLWRSLVDQGGMEGSAFSSPVLAPIHGEIQLLVQTRRALAGLEPETGRPLWSRDIPAYQGMNILTPTVDSNRVFTTSYGGGSVLVDLRRKPDGSFEAEEEWKTPIQGYMSTPLLIEGHLYLHLRNQRLTCIDWGTGKTRWTTGERFGKYMSLVGEGRRILALDERGILYLLEADPKEFRLLDSRRVSEAACWAHLAVSGEDLFIRELEAVSAFKWREAPGPSVEPPLERAF